MELNASIQPSRCISIDVNTKYLEVEFTENMALDNEEQFKNIMSQLHSHGFKVSMDDFGTGYSSLGLLKDFAFDTIKIDRSFFVETKDVKRADNIIVSIMELAKRLHMITVAEGVESKEMVDYLHNLGCNLIQGYYYYKPLTIQEFEKLL